MFKVPYRVSIKYIINILFLFSFFIYIKKLPIDVETQPFLIFAISLFILPFIKLRLSKKDILLICSLLILTVYAIFQLVIFKTGLVSYVTYLVGPLVYVIFLNRVNCISTFLLKTIIIVFAIISLILLFKIPIFITVYEGFHNLFISRNIQGDYSGLRGLSLIAPEPSYFAFSAILLLTFIDYKILYSNSTSLNKYKFLVIIISLCTKSALVFFYIGIYFFGYFFGGSILKKLKSFKFKNLFIILLILITALIPFLFLKQSRPAQVINNVYESYEKGVSLERLLIKESSGSTRFIVNTLGFMSITYAPFGWGLGNFQKNIPTVGQNIDHLLLKHEILRDAYTGKKFVKAQTYFANLIGDIGLFSLPLLLFFMISFFGADNPINNALKFLLPLMLIIVQGQISNPSIWILLAMLNSHKEKKKI